MRRFNKLCPDTTRRAVLCRALGQLFGALPVVRRLLGYNMDLSHFGGEETSFCIPAIKAPRPLHCNPFGSECHDFMQAWSLEFYGSGVPKELGAQLVQAMVHVYPTAPLQELILISQVSIWIVMLDDCCNEEVLAQHTNILNGVYDAEGDNKLGMVDQLWKALSLFMPKSVFERLRGYMVSLPSSNSAENAFRNKIKGQVPTAESYKKVRDKFIFLVYFPLTEYARGIDLGQDVLQRKEIQQLENVVLEQLMLVNDIFSFKKEWANGDYFNMVPIIGCHSKCSLQEAVLEAVKMANEAEEQYEELSRKILSMPEFANNAAVAKYIEGLADLIVGNLEFHWYAARYHGLDWVQPEKRSGSTITLGLKK